MEVWKVKGRDDLNSDLLDWAPLSAVRRSVEGRRHDCLLSRLDSQHQEDWLEQHDYHLLAGGRRRRVERERERERENEHTVAMVCRSSLSVIKSYILTTRTYQLPSTQHFFLLNQCWSEKH